MFQSFIYRSSQWWQIEAQKVIDTTFVAELDMDRYDRISIALVDAVIAVYSERKLNVAGNLARALYIWYPKHTNNDALWAITQNKHDNPNYAKYACEVDRYLILL